MVVIDPGHGGSGRTGDPGAPGRCGVPEKDVALSISKKLHGLIRDSVLTRDTDAYVSLSKRAIFANQRGADLFISIHANSVENERVEGIEVFHHPQSAEGGRIAASVQASLMETFPEHKNRGVKTAPFQVLRQTRMPAILVECEFLSNPRWCSWLTQPDIQLRYAEAIARAIDGVTYRVTVDGSVRGSFRRPLDAVEEALEDRPGRIVVEQI